MNVSAIATPLSLQTGASPEAASGETPSRDAAPASSFDAMLAAVPAQGAGASPHGKPSAAHKGEREGGEASADTATPDSPQTVVLAAPVTLPLPTPSAGELGVGARKTPASGEGTRPSAVGATVGLTPAATDPAIAGPDTGAGISRTPGAAATPPAAAPAISQVLPAAEAPAATAPQPAALPVASTVSTPPTVSAVPTPAAPTVADTQAASQSVASSLAEGGAIDLDALFPRGGDKPLHITFPSATANASASPIASAPPSAVALTQATVKVVPFTAEQPKTASTGDTGDTAPGIAASAPVPSQATASAQPPLVAAPPPGALTPPGVALPPAVPSAEGVVLQHHIDLAQDSAWLDGLARDIARSAGSASDTTGASMLNFRISPRNMGDVRVVLAAGAEGTAIHMTADTAAAHALLTDSRHVLVAQAEAHGMRVTEARIDLASNAGQTSSGAPSHQQGAPNGGGGQGAAPEQRGNLLTMLPQRERQGDKAAPSVPRRERYA